MRSGHLFTKIYDIQQIIRYMNHYQHLIARFCRAFFPAPAAFSPECRGERNGK
jgi:hypothetical protein